MKVNNTQQMQTKLFELCSSLMLVTLVMHLTTYSEQLFLYKLHCFKGICALHVFGEGIFTLLPNFGGFHRTLQRVRPANRGRLLLRTPVLSNLGLEFVPMLRQFFPELIMSTDLSVSNIPR